MNTHNLWIDRLMPVHVRLEAIEREANELSRDTARVKLRSTSVEVTWVTGLMVTPRSGVEANDVTVVMQPILNLGMTFGIR